MRDGCNSHYDAEELLALWCVLHVAPQALKCRFNDLASNLQSQMDSRRLEIVAKVMYFYMLVTGPPRHTSDASVLSPPIAMGSAGSVCFRAQLG